MELNFPPAPQSEDTDNLAKECQCCLQPIINEVLRTAVAAGWSESDVLLAMADLAWDLYERCRSDSSSHDREGTRTVG